MLRDAKSLYGEVGTSDLQGIVSAKVIKIMGPKVQTRENLWLRSKAEDVILQYVYGETSMAGAKQGLKVIDARLR